MNVVLYTQALEPITVVDVPARVWGMLVRGERVNLATPCEEVPVYVASGAPVTDFVYRTVTVFAERFCYRGHESWMLFTHNEEDALLLKSEFLPGQRREVQHLRKDARIGGFAQGFLAALDQMR